MRLHAALFFGAQLLSGQCRTCEATYIILEHMLHDQVMVAQIALDRKRARLLDLVAMRFPSHKPRHGVALVDEELQNVPADEPRTDEEDFL